VSFPAADPDRLRRRGFRLEYATKDVYGHLDTGCTGCTGRYGACAGGVGASGSAAGAGGLR